MTAGPGLFISHAVADAPIVNLFVDLIEGGIGVPPARIFCTSRKGQGVRPGAEFKASIGQSLSEATTVVALISENFYSSPFCMCELGGTWLQAKDFIPILVPPVRFADMRAVLNGLQASRLDSPEDLDELRDTVAERLGLQALSTPRWNERRNQFVEALAEKLKQLPRPASVPRAELEKLEKVVAEYWEELERSRQEYAALRALLEDVKKAKDARAVAEIQRQHMSENEAFESLVSAVRKSINDISNVAKEVSYAWQCGDDYAPGSSSSKYGWDDARSSIDYKQIALTQDERSVRLNGDHPKVALVISSLEALDHWLTSQAPETFYEWYRTAHDGYSPDLSDRSFWDRHFW